MAIKQRNLKLFKTFSLASLFAAALAPIGANAMHPIRFPLTNTTGSGGGTGPTWLTHNPPGYTARYIYGSGGFEGGFFKVSGPPTAEKSYLKFSGNYTPGGPQLYGYSGGGSGIRDPRTAPLGSGATGSSSSIGTGATTK